MEWPDGRRAALFFVVEEETQPGRFSIHRLAYYCLDLAELLDTERVVPAVISKGHESLGRMKFWWMHNCRVALVNRCRSVV